MQDTVGGSVYTVTVTWYLNASGTQVLTTDTIIVGMSIKRIGWRPIVAPYMRIQAVKTGPALIDDISILVIPSTMESLVGGRATQQSYINTYESTVSAGLYTDYTSTYVMAGPALLTLRSNIYYMTFDLAVMDGTGTYNSVMRYQVTEPNMADQYNLLLPDAPVRLRAFNAGLYALATYDIILTPA